MPLKNHFWFSKEPFNEQFLNELRNQISLDRLKYRRSLRNKNILQVSLQLF